jgi:hypothetical protein
MIGLKLFLPLLSPHLRRSPAALYERQRALVRLGIIAAEKGRGPGSGVRATPQNVAAVILSVLVTDNLSDIDGRVGMFSDLERTRREHSGIETAKNFGDALVQILSDFKLAETVNEITVWREGVGAFAEIRFTTALPHSSVYFGTMSELAPLKIRATLDGKILRNIAVAIAVFDTDDPANSELHQTLSDLVASGQIPLRALFRKEVPRTKRRKGTP